MRLTGVLAQSAACTRRQLMTLRPYRLAHTTSPYRQNIRTYIPATDSNMNEMTIKPSHKISLIVQCSLLVTFGPSTFPSEATWPTPIPKRAIQPCRLHPNLYMRRSE